MSVLGVLIFGASLLAEDSVQLDFSAFPSLSSAQQSEIQQAAIAAADGQSYSAQDVVDELIKLDWFDFLPISDNLLTSSSIAANQGEEIDSFRSVTTSKTATFLGGTRGTKSANGIALMDSSYAGSMNVDPNMTMIAVAQDLATSSAGAYFLDADSPRRIFAASGFSNGDAVGQLSYFDGSAPWHPSISSSDILSLYSIEVTDTTVNFDLSGNRIGPITIDPVVSNAAVTMSFFGRVDNVTPRYALDGEVRGLFYASAIVDAAMIRRFASEYYSVSIPDNPLDLSGLVNLPTPQLSAIETAAIAAADGQTYSAQEVVDAVAQTEWLDGKIGRNYVDAAKTTVAAAGQSIQVSESITSTNQASQPSELNRPIQQDRYIEFVGENKWLEVGNLFSNSISQLGLILVFRIAGYNSGAFAPGTILLAHRSQTDQYLTIIVNTGGGINIKDATQPVQTLPYNPDIGINENYTLTLDLDVSSQAVLRVNSETRTTLNFNFDPITSTRTLLGGQTTTESDFVTPFTGRVYGMFQVAISDSVALEKIERFAQNYYFPRVETNLDLSGLINLPASRQAAIEESAKSIGLDSPQSVIDLVATSIWLNPVSSSLISSFTDNSTITQSQTNFQPVFEPVSVPYLNFDGLDDFLIGTISTSLPKTFFLIERNMSGSTGASPISYEGGNNAGIIIQNNAGVQFGAAIFLPSSTLRIPFNSTGIRILTVVITDTLNVGYINGSISAQRDFNTTFTGNFLIGKRFVSDIEVSMDFFGLVVFDQFLSSTQIANVNDFLFKYYSIG